MPVLDSDIDAQLDEQQYRAFREWLLLRNKMDEDRSPEAALAAGKAYGRFFALFTENSGRPSTKVIPFPRRLSDHSGDAA